ncbi:MULTISPECIES: DsbC family protein [Sphingomonas]|jgi:thiol:disulfide interchange protein DsbC|uniref:Thiol:disulfide interchange protein n=1 Tax=Sphingomonas turrisvirgatae TaxID=1888892 RepID=A0A1E3LYE1_9SPHN|nr:DsbC family protein [Sphingomonas turrisvirgatae]ODP38801.1 protein-disulfide isomerase [Sphingomonas turrisvirgatae]
MLRVVEVAIAVALLGPNLANAQGAPAADTESFAAAAAEAQQALRQTFTNLQFEDFGPAPVKGPLYQANAGGRMIYFAPESGHLLFAAVYDRNGVNVTALAQDASARKRFGAIDTSQALAIGPPGARQVIEFTDPDCPYCQALDRYWSAKAAEGKQVRRLIFFVSGIHAQAAAKAEHILCSPDPAAAFKAIYAGTAPKTPLKCPEGARKVAAQGEAVRKLGISGTPTLFLDGKMISGFQQAEIEAFLEASQRVAEPPG